MLPGRSHELPDPRESADSGIYACAIVARHPHLRATVLEKPPVDAVARRAIERRGLSAKVSVVAGSAV